MDPGVKLLALLHLLLLGAQATVAADPGSDHARSLLERDVLLGELGGNRTALEDRGVDFSLLYIQEYLGVVAGGIVRRGESNGLLQIDLNLDLEKLAGWRGALLHATGFVGWGRSLSGLWIGDDSNVSNINMRNGARFFDAYLQQSFGEVLFIRAGFLSTDTEFTSSTVEDTHSRGGALFINSDFGAPPILTLNVPVPTFPLAVPGVTGTLAFTSALRLRAGIYDGQPLPATPSDDRNAYGLDPDLRASDGALFVAELEYDVNPSAEAGTGKETKTPPPSRRLGGCYRIGAFYHTGTFTEWTSSRSTQGLGGGWISGNQMVWREPGQRDEDDQGLSIFLRVSTAPRDRSVLEFCADGGLHYHGLLPGRPEDDLGLGVSRKRYSRDFSRSERAAGNAGRDHETIVELSYIATVTPWLAVQPDVQYVIHPAGQHSAADALVAGLRVTMSF